MKKTLVKIVSMNTYVVLFIVATIVMRNFANISMRKKPQNPIKKILRQRSKPNE